MSSSPPIVPVPPYFVAHTNLMEMLSASFALVGHNLQDHEYLVHRGVFYANVAAVIRLLLDFEFKPFIDSAYNWTWWAEQCEARALALGKDAQFAMHLPPPRDPEKWTDYPALTNLTDKMTSLMLSVTKQEEEDADISDMGNLTPAECVKLTHRFAHYWLGKNCGTYERGYIVPWPWIAKVASELQYLYRSMGEPDRAGSSGAPGGPIPPISWPG